MALRPDQTRVPVANPTSVLHGSSPHPQKCAVMQDRTILLVSSDASFVDFVREGLPAREESQLHVMETPEGAARLVGWQDVELIILHLDPFMKDRSVARLVWKAAALPRRIPILAVSDGYEPERALAMFRLGVADYLSRVDHLREILPLIDSLSAGGRMDAEWSLNAATGPIIRFDWSAFSTS